MKKSQILVLVFFSLLFSSIYVWQIVFHIENNNILKISFLDIGQGDSIYIEAPNGNQLVVDGSPGPIELRKLGEVMPWYDNSLNILLVTNPDKDHFAGFIDVLNRFKVGEVIEPGTFNKSATYQTFEDTIKEKKIPEVLGYRGMVITLDKIHNVTFTILFPDRDVSTWTTNDGSIVGKLTYGKISFMLNGDATQAVENYLVKNDSQDLPADVLKLGHHGSKTSSSKEFLQAVHPQYAIISAGLNNIYGFPHQETLDNLKTANIPYLETFKEGTITFETDGKTLWRK